jgi:creatinine amidohydrolase
MMDVEEVRWERLFPDQIEARFAATPLLYLPYGICEPHGPQNVLGLDALKAHAIAIKAAQVSGGIVAPPDYWHIHEVGLYATWARREVGEVARHWLTAVPPWVHFKNVCYQIRAAERLGFKAVILLTGHYGPNWRDLKTVVELMQPHLNARLYGLPDFEANHRGFAEDGKSGSDHAGRVETSLLWALEPSGVDYSRLPELPLSPRDDALGGQYFAMGRDAHQSNRQVGDRMVAEEVAFLAAKAAELLKAYDGRPAPVLPVWTFEDVELFWEREVAPILGQFKSMEGYADRHSDMETIGEGSVWKRGSTGPLRS